MGQGRIFEGILGVHARRNQELDFGTRLSESSIVWESMIMGYKRMTQRSALPSPWHIYKCTSIWSKNKNQSDINKVAMMSYEWKWFFNTLHNALFVIVIAKEDACMIPSPVRLYTNFFLSSPVIFFFVNSWNLNFFRCYHCEFVCYFCLGIIMATISCTAPWETVNHQDSSRCRRPKSVLPSTRHTDT